jgi:hypothetical protein
MTNRAAHGEWCGRRQVVKKDYWGSLTGKLNAYAVVQAAPETEKYTVFFRSNSFRIPTTLAQVFKCLEGLKIYFFP